MYPLLYLLNFIGKGARRVVQCVRINLVLITGPPTHSVGARLVTVAGVCRRLLSSVTRAHMQRNSPEAARDGRTVVLRPVRATLC